ncbi:copper homeostasis protein CutC [Lacipirellula sp.]|uniref:copper homeostasis protein CutC n=1 Tax=Lacipirellula sp. TaxID=2691419 RepID=UPI003D096B77
MTTALPAEKITLEVCVGSVADARAAITAGADRLELCSGLEVGGLTPSIGLVETVVAASSVPVIAMLRPRAGGFCYDADEFAAMLRDAERFLAARAAGVAFGILDQRGRLDAARSREIIARAGTRDTVMHRAFDFTVDQFAALDTLIELKVTRILTSGGEPAALAGSAKLHELATRAAGRIELMAGGGINADNVGNVLTASGLRQVHIGASGPADDRSIAPTASINLCDQRFFHGAEYRVVVQNSVAATAAALRNAC